MDSLSYFYYAGKNQLSRITDVVPVNNFSNDIDNQNTNNYSYDLIGNLTKGNSEKLKISWTHYGKVKQTDSIINSTTTQPKLEFTYDALGNRLIKENVKNNTKEIYVRDATGNLITLYSIRNDSLFTKEFYMYGSSRLGSLQEEKFLAKKNKISNFLISNFSTLKYSNQVPRNVNYIFGKKRYEINDWLGNVRVVISDKKIPVISGNIVTGYKADVRSVTDYYPFGMSIAERRYEKKKYRFGFNTQEKIRELNDDHYTALFWEYDARIGRRWNRDPVMKEWESPYAPFANNPIWFADLAGLDTFAASTNEGAPPPGSDITKDVFQLKEFIFTASAPSWISKSWSNIKNWAANTDFIFELSGKVDVGVQLRLRGSYAGIVQGQANANLFSFGIFSGRVDFTELSSDNPDAYSGDYIGSGSGAKVTQSIGVTGGVAGYDVIGANATHSFKTHGEGYFDDKVDYGISAVAPIFKNKNAKQVQDDALKSMNLLKSPQVKNPRVGKQGDFYGVDVGVGAALILGVDVGLKIGFKQ